MRERGRKLVQTAQLLRLLHCCCIQRSSIEASLVETRNEGSSTPHSNNQARPSVNATQQTCLVELYVLTGLAVPVICSSVFAKVARKFWPASKAFLKGLTISGIARPGSPASPPPPPSPSAPLSPLVSLPVSPPSLARSSPAPSYPSSPAPARSGDTADAARGDVRAAA